MSFTDLNLQSSYETDENDIINDFYVVEKQVPVKQGLQLNKNTKTWYRKWKNYENTLNKNND